MKNWYTKLYYDHVYEVKVCLHGLDDGKTGGKVELTKVRSWLYK